MKFRFCTPFAERESRFVIPDTRASSGAFCVVISPLAMVENCFAQILIVCIMG